jgi:hypothetical protein
MKNESPNYFAKAEEDLRKFLKMKPGEKIPYKEKMLEKKRPANTPLTNSERPR